MKKTVIIIVIILAVGGFAAYRFMYKEHRDISSEDASFTITVSELQKAFADNDSLANAKYADKTIAVSGKITGSDAATRTITVDEKLSAVMNKPLGAEAGTGNAIRIKGRFVGYDDLLEELKMDQVSIIK